MGDIRKSAGDNARLLAMKQEKRGWANAAEAIIAEIDKQDGKLCDMAAPLVARFRAELVNIATIRSQQCDRLDEKIAQPGGEAATSK